jgi:carboxymethylenebutenolidase
MKRCALLPLALLLAGCASRTAPAPERSLVESVRYPSWEGEGSGLLYRQAGPGPFPALVVVHNDAGLTERIRSNAQRLADQGHVVLAVDLYRGAKVQDDVEAAHVMDRAMPEERTLGDLRAAVSYLAGLADVRPEAIGIVGFGSGGGYALDAAVADGRLRAVVTCYGRLRTTPEGLKGLRAPVLGVFAGKDDGTPQETIDAFQQALAEAGKPRAEEHVYARHDHGFLDQGAPAEGDAGEDVEDAWKRIEAFLRKELRGTEGAR